MLATAMPGVLTEKNEKINIAYEQRTARSEKIKEGVIVIKRYINGMPANAWSVVICTSQNLNIK